MQPVQEDIDRRRSEEIARSNRAEETLWTVVGRLYAWRKFIVGVTAAVAVSAVVISLLLPNWYRASARVLIPESQGGGLSSAILGNLPAAASALLGGGPGGDYTRYLAILTSRSMMEAAVDSFNLVQVYEVEDSETPRDDAIRQLADNAEFEIDMEFDFLRIAVLDKDRERAAQMANFFVRRLNVVNARLTSESASNYRKFIEGRYLEARADMDSVLNATQQFQQKYGIFDLPAQTEAFFEQAAELRQGALEAEIRHEALLTQFGSDNAQVQSMREIAEAANRKYQQALAGQEQLLPVPRSEVPDVAREYVNLELERTIQRSILEVIGPLYEQARFQEERETQAVQVIDEATPPVRKAKPKRSIICILATLSAFMVAAGFVLIYEWWRTNHRRILYRINSVAANE